MTTPDKMRGVRSFEEKGWWKMRSESFGELGTFPRLVRVTLLVSIVALLVGLNPMAGRASSQEDCGDPDYAADRIIVKMKDGASEEAIARIKTINGEGEEIKFSTGAWTADLPAGYTVPEAIELYESDPDVEYAEPDYYAYPAQHCSEGGAAFGRLSLTALIPLSEARSSLTQHPYTTTGRTPHPT